MKKSVKKKWIAALESGDYKRGTTRLRKTDTNDEERFCCLGVLCDISGLGVWETPNFNLGMLKYTTDLGSETTLPTPDVTRWAGIDEKTMTELAILNDSVKDGLDDTFAVVIDKIRSL